MIQLIIDVLGYQCSVVSHSRQRGGREKKEITHEQRFHMVTTMSHKTKGMANTMYMKMHVYSTPCTLS